MSPNQRLMIAVVVTILFFVGYTAIIPPKPNLEQTGSASTTQKSHEAQKVVSNDVKDTPDVSMTTLETKTKSTDLLTTVSSNDFILKVDTLGRISSVVLNDKKHNDKNNKQSELISPDGAKPLQIKFADEELNRLASTTPYTTTKESINLGENGKGSIILKQNLPDLVVSKKITFYADGHYDIDISLSQEKKYFLYLGQHPKIAEQMMTVNGSMVYHGDSKYDIFEDGDVDSRTIFGDVHLVSSFDQYYATIFYGFKPDTQVYVDRDANSNGVVSIDASKDLSLHGYVGPKEYKTLKSIDPVLVNAIEFGWFTFVANPIFKILLWLHGIFGNWGWAIIALTILIRIVLYPLTQKGMVSMQKIKEIAPRIKELQEKHKGDPARMNAAVMEMYKKHGANPLGGCLPLLLQIPVFFAIYRVLLNAVELQGAPWILWVNDLSRMDPYFILPLLMGATMYYQQRITPSNFTDPLQEKIFKFLPVIFTFFFITFPSGLVLYWFVNNLFSIAQQYLVNKQFEAARAARAEQHS